MVPDGVRARGGVEAAHFAGSGRSPAARRLFGPRQRSGLRGSSLLSSVRCHPTAPQIQLERTKSGLTSRMPGQKWDSQWFEDTEYVVGRDLAEAGHLSLAAFLRGRLEGEAEEEEEEEEEGGCL